MCLIDKFFFVFDYLCCVMFFGIYIGEVILLYIVLKIDMVELSGIVVVEFWFEWRLVVRNKEFVKIISFVM